MKLLQLNIHRLRNLNELLIEPSPTINLFTGQNGSGKTSILEAIYFISLARSFRSRQVKYLIQNDKNTMTLYAQIKNDEIQSSIGIERDKQGHNVTRLNGESLTSLSALAQLCPVQLIHPDGFHLLSGGPKARRQFLDWGVFHVKLPFVKLWQQSQRLLKQRNAALKYGATQDSLDPWNQELCTLATQIDTLRQHYLSSFNPLFQDMISTLLPTLGTNIRFQFQRGWPQHQTLLETLAHDFHRDKLLGFTQHGPQRASFQLTINHHPVDMILSQGQQKLVVCALKLAQAKMLQVTVNRSCIFLLDDIPAELDDESQQRFGGALAALNCQVFATALKPEHFEAMSFLNGSIMTLPGAMLV